MTTIATTFRSHPDPSALAAFLAARLSHDEVVAVEEHLRTGCLRCLLNARECIASGEREAQGMKVSEFFTREGGPLDSGDLRSYALRIERKALLLESEEKVTSELMAELMLRPSASRRQMVRESRRYQLLALSETLRHESLREVFHDVARAVELAELSAEVADCLDTAYYGASLVADARALAWAVVGNSRRVAGDFFGAERTFQTSLNILEQGTGSPGERAEVFSLLASLRAEQAQFREAIHLLENVARTYRELGLEDREGKAVFKLGNTAIAAGEPARALQLFQASLDLLHPGKDPKLTLWAHHNIAACLSDSGSHQEAKSYLQEVAPLYDRFPEDRTIHVRRRWLEGRIAAGLRDFNDAELILCEVRNLFLEEERGYDTALVTLDLATVYLEAGKTDEVKQLAREMYPAFRSQDIHREALAALLLFERAAATETVTLALTQDIAQYLTRARNNPYLRYRPTGSATLAAEQ